MRRALFLAFMVAAGCGYRFATPGGALPGGARSVHVPVFENRSQEPSVEAFVTEAVRERYARAGLLGGAASETTLTGVVLGVTASPTVVYNSTQGAPTYQVSATVQVTLAKGGVVLGQSVVSLMEEFPSGADVLLTEANRGAALRRLAEALARELVDRLAAAPGARP